MENDEGVKVDLYIPRKCSYTNRIIESKDHASIQINFAVVDANGVYTGENTTLALCGFVREKGTGDEAINRLMTTRGVLKHVL